MRRVRATAGRSIRSAADLERVPVAIPESKTLSLGKLRRLQQAATAGGTFAILAIDHRGPLRRALASRGQAEVSPG